jgi:hypothetical protein
VAGKCDIKGSTTVPSPAQLVGTLPIAVSTIVLQTRVFDARSVIPAAHGPPTYLRNLSLRI